MSTGCHDFFKLRSPPILAVMCWFSRCDFVWVLRSSRENPGSKSRSRKSNQRTRFLCPTFSAVPAFPASASYLAMATAFGALSSSLELDHNFSKYDIQFLAQDIFRSATQRRRLQSQRLIRRDTIYGLTFTPQNTAIMSDDDDFMQASDDEKYDMASMA
jgi:hypothetical protein